MCCIRNGSRMKYYLITSGKILETISDHQLWLIEVTTEEERKKRCYRQAARISPLVSIETHEQRKSFEKIREAVDSIWNKSSDVKDFAKRLCDACISDRFFDEVKFYAEKRNESQTDRNVSI